MIPGETDPPPATPTRADLAAEAVRDWRVVRLIDIGVDVDQAIDLAPTHLDVHDLENLLERGCPLPVALEILL